MALMMYGDGWGWSGWLVMTAVMVLLWAMVITAAVVGIRYLAGARNSTPHAPDSTRPRPEDLLAERFARGEIDSDEYQSRVALLREHR